MGWLSFLPDWGTLVFFVLFPATLAIAMHLVVRRFVSHELLLPHHDVAGFLVAIVGVLYAVVLGFVVVTVWSNFDSVQRTVDLEAGDVGDAYSFSFMLADPPRRQVQKMLASYAVEVRDREFPALRAGRTDPNARAFLIGGFVALVRTPARPTSNVAEALRAESARQSVLSALRDVADNRRIRIIEARDKLPPLLYLALVFGAAMVLVFVFLFGVKHAVLQLTMTGIVAGCIGLLLGVIVAFNAPFQGAIRVSPEAWNDLIGDSHLRRISTTQTPTPPPPAKR